MKNRKKPVKGNLKTRIGELLRSYLRESDGSEAIAALSEISELSGISELSEISEKSEKSELSELSELSKSPERSDSSESLDNSDSPDSSDNSDSPDSSDSSDHQPKCCLPFAVRRNLAVSLRQIREFAEEHELAMEMIEAALRILLEIAAGMAKGKITTAMLQCALKVLNYERDRKQAHDEGVVEGRNETIGARYLNDTDDGLPHLASGPVSGPTTSSIFDLARECRNS